MGNKWHTEKTIQFNPKGGEGKKRKKEKNWFKKKVNKTKLPLWGRHLGIKKKVGRKLYALGPKRPRHPKEALRCWRRTNLIPSPASCFMGMWLPNLWNGFFHYLSLNHFEYHFPVMLWSQSRRLQLKLSVWNTTIDLCIQTLGPQWVAFLWK